MEQVSTHSKTTRFANLASWQARLVLAVFAMFIVWGIVCCDKSSRSQQVISNTNRADVQLYRSIVRRVHTGEGYYEVVGSELRARNYATRPFFNWRLPTLALFLGKLTTPEIGKWTLTALASVTLVAWLLILTKEHGFHTTLLGGWILLGTLVSCFTDEAFLFHELWAGVLIALSIAAHARNRALSVALGLLALSIRELSLPFALVMLIIAYREKHHREAIAWLLGIVAFFLYLTVHATTVSTFFIDADRANATWLQFGGLSFVLTTTKWTLLTFVSPWWIDVFLLPLAFIGLAGWWGPVGTRVALTMGLYTLAWLIVGRSDNYYWGLMCAPLIPLGLLHAPRSVAELLRTAVGTRK